MLTIFCPKLFPLCISVGSFMHCQLKNLFSKHVKMEAEVTGLVGMIAGSVQDWTEECGCISKLLGRCFNVKVVAFRCAQCVVFWWPSVERRGLSLIYWPVKIIVLSLLPVAKSMFKIAEQFLHYQKRETLLDSLNVWALLYINVRKLFTRSANM